MYFLFDCRSDIRSVSFTFQIFRFLYCFSIKCSLPILPYLACFLLAALVFALILLMCMSSVCVCQWRAFCGAFPLCFQHHKKLSKKKLNPMIIKSLTKSRKRPNASICVFSSFTKSSPSLLAHIAALPTHALHIIHNPLHRLRPFPAHSDQFSQSPVDSAEKQTSTRTGLGCSKKCSKLGF